MATLTTVAYRRGVIAGDTMISASDNMDGYAVKVGERNGILFGAAGSLALMQDFLAWVHRGMPDSPPSMVGFKDSQASGFIAMGDNILAFDPYGIELVTADCYAIGSGKEFAIGAMLAGKNPTQAVKIAAKRDLHTGGKIITLRSSKYSKSSRD